jgi:hypothetical protein
MSKLPPPTRPRKGPRHKRLKITRKDKWERILNDVDKTQVPITCLESIDVNLKDGTIVRIDIIELLEVDGQDPDEVEQSINSRLDSMGDIIRDVDFYINLDKVADTITPLTDELLKDL